MIWEEIYSVNTLLKRIWICGAEEQAIHEWQILSVIKKIFMWQIRKKAKILFVNWIGSL